MSDQKKTKEQLIGDLVALRRKVTNLQIRVKTKSNTKWSSMKNLLKKGEEQGRLAANASPVMIAEIGSDQRYRFANKAYEDFFGVPGVRITGEHISQVLEDQAYQAARANVELVLTGQEVSIEAESYGKNNDMHHISVKYVPHVGENHNVNSFFILAYDITEQKRGEERIKLIQLAFDRSPDCALFKRQDGSLFYSNETAGKTLGYSKEELLTMSTFDINPDFPAEAWPEFWEKLKEVKHFIFDTRLRAKDGRVFPVEINCNYLELGGKEYICAYARNITERNQAEEELLLSRKRFQALSHQLLDLQEAERRHIARDLHDEIGQSLTALKMNLHAAQRASVPPDIQYYLEDSVRLADDLFHHVRNLSADLRPALLDDLGLITALRWYVTRHGERAGIAIEFTADKEETRLLPAIETACFRIVQEALTNVIKHAQTKRVFLSLSTGEETLLVTIRDEGVGFNVPSALSRASRGNSMGLLSMQERTQLLGGKIAITSTPMHGTEIRVRIPLPRRNPSGDSTEQKTS